MLKRFLCVLLISILVLTLFCGINISAVENTDITFSYSRNGKWNEFSGKTIFSDYIDCLKIQTSPEKDYYLSYKTWNEGASGYFSEVKSNLASSEEYAGAAGKKIRNLSILVHDKNGNKIDTGIVVMYRAFVGGVWLPWVSNATADWMSYVQRKYQLDGVIDTNAGNAGINTDYIGGLEIRIFEEENIDDISRTENKATRIDAPLISQLNDYPTGCESVSAVMALRHRGFDISVDEFIDSYLETGNPDSFDPNLCFGGNPRNTSGIGCYAPVIQNALNKYLESTDKTAVQINNYSLNRLCEEYIDNGVPVIIWATVNMQKASTGKKMQYGDKIIQWISPEHCLLLVGYDKENYYFNDPQKPDSVTYYSKNDTENAYCALGCQAVAIVNKPLADECFSISNTEYKYNGTVRTPAVTVKDAKGNILKKDKDYTISYDSGRKNVGSYKVNLQMKGNYTGTKDFVFKIKPINISDCSIKLSAESYTYNGTVRTPNVIVKNRNGTTLTKNNHYTISYASGRKNTGTYAVTVKMKGNYSGTKTLSFKILPQFRKENGVWRYYNGDGTLNKANTLVKHTDGNYYHVNGGRLINDTTLVKYNNKWYHVKNGVKSDYTGLFKYNGVCYYIKNGAKKSADTLVKHTDGKWYHVKGGKIIRDTTLIKYNNKWYHVKSGVKSNYTGLFKYNGVWYYIKNGTKNNTTTLVKHTNGKWYLVKGGKTVTDTTIIKYGTKHYYVKNGVKSNLTGYVKLSGKTYKIKNDVVI